MVTKKRVVKDDGIYWVVLERRLMSVKAVALHRTQEDAGTDAEERDFDSGSRFNTYIVQRVELSKDL